ncbi:glucose-1-phosphate adenylyltransferase [Motilimonas pumila]|uniref:Glucose-1-phosphate adenylyltransferase n=1 Tax=Motilimonas pumila TaxID=2303987 RepID=A0A418YKK3_9GAMM|nr:glucose-1-phosphate adenylyltransferase [Motilimonas pumila]RJG51511.1 glucose-1-phosphate adenylyltransferase [Motilimonas pumila]
MAGVLAMVLAGGEGKRLHPLTETRSKPSVPFGGSYRLLDFALNNFVNADILQIYVLTQFKSQSLNIHLRQAWHLSGITNRFIDPVPAQQRLGKRWYDGTADAIYQNNKFIEMNEPEQVCIFGSDHIYKMDVRQMVNYHKEKDAHLTVAAIQVPKDQAYHFGIIEVDKEGRMIGFQEKPSVEEAKTIPGDPEHVLASMGNYTFDTKVLLSELSRDAEDEDSEHDFGKNIIPHLFPQGKVFVYNFNSNKIAGEPDGVYWRDVGTLDAYWEAHMDLLADEPPFSLYNRKWPLHTYYPPLPPATFKDSENHNTRISKSLLSAGCYVLGSHVHRSVMGFHCHIRPGTEISESVLLGEVKVGENCRIRRAIIDKNVEIAPGTVIGEDLAADKARFDVSENGIVVIAKNTKVGF